MKKKKINSLIFFQRPSLCKCLQTMPICPFCEEDLASGSFARNSMGGCRKCNHERCVRKCSSCKNRLSSNQFRETTRNQLMQNRKVDCDDCKLKSSRESDRKRDAELREQLQNKVCTVHPDGSCQVDLPKLTSLCTCGSDRSLPYDKRKALWHILQNVAIALEEKERVDAICAFLKQIPAMYSEMQSCGVGDITWYKFRSVSEFLDETKEPYDASIAAVFDHLHRNLYWRPNRTQCTRWLSQFSLNHYRVCTFLCLQSRLRDSKLPIIPKVIKELHTNILKFVGIMKYEPSVRAWLQELNKKQYEF